MDLANVACERVVLAGVYHYNMDGLIDAQSVGLTTQSFTLDSNQVIWKVFEKILSENNNSTIDFGTFLAVADQLKLGTFFKAKTERDHLQAIMNTPINKENVRRHAATVKKLEVARNLYATVEDIKGNLATVSGEEPLERIIALAEEPILEFSRKLGDDQEDLRLVGDSLEEYVQYLADNPRTMAGISTGFPIYDRTLGGGLRAGEVMVMAARQKYGKSIVGANVALHTSTVLQLPTVVLDTELSYDFYVHRLLACLSGVKTHEIETGRFGKDARKRQKVLATAKKLKVSPFTYQNIAGKTFEEALALIRRWVIRKVGLNEDGKAKPCVLIYDYLKVMDMGWLKKLQETQLLGFAISQLKDTVNKYGISCLALAQVNREGTVAFSDRFGMFCGALHILKEKTVDDDNYAEYNMMLEPTALRFGEKLQDGDYINYNRQGAIAKFTEGPTRNELQLNSGSNSAVTSGFEITDADTDTNGDVGTAT